MTNSGRESNFNVLLTQYQLFVWRWESVFICGHNPMAHFNSSPKCFWKRPISQDIVADIPVILWHFSVSIWNSYQSIIHFKVLSKVLLFKNDSVHLFKNKDQMNENLFRFNVFMFWQFQAPIGCLFTRRFNANKFFYFVITINTPVRSCGSIFETKISWTRRL